MGPQGYMPSAQVDGAPPSVVSHSQQPVPQPTPSGGMNYGPSSTSSVPQDMAPPGPDAAGYSNHVPDQQAQQQYQQQPLL